MTTTTFRTTDPREVEMLAAANHTRAQFDRVPPRKHTKVLKRLIADAEIVLGIYVEDGSLKTTIIKGEMRLEMIGQADAAIHVGARVIHVREAAEAEAMRQVFGDGARLH